jgi:hypothetical protein
MCDGGGDTRLIESMWSRRLGEDRRVGICKLVEKLKEAVWINESYGLANAKSERLQ